VIVWYILASLHRRQREPTAPLCRLHKLLDTDTSKTHAAYKPHAAYRPHAAYKTHAVVSRWQKTPANMRVERFFGTLINQTFNVFKETDLLFAEYLSKTQFSRFHREGMTGSTCPVWSAKRPLKQKQDTECPSPRAVTVVIPYHAEAQVLQHLEPSKHGGCRDWLDFDAVPGSIARGVSCASTGAPGQEECVSKVPQRRGQLHSQCTTWCPPFTSRPTATRSIWT